MTEIRHPEGAMRDMASRLLDLRQVISTPKSGPAAPNNPPRRSPRQFDDHPGVVMVRERNARSRAIWDLTGMPDPLYLAREGHSGAVIQGRDRELSNFAGYNYLGLAHHPKVIRAVQDAVARYGASASNGRISSGEIELYPRLERRLAQVYDVDAALIANSGFLTNAGVLGYLLGEGDAAICDSLIHASVVAGARWAGARVMTFRHNDPEALRGILRASRNRFKRVLVVIEGLYSMDGDIGPLPEIAAVAREFGCAVMVDEAHSIGVLGASGRGVREHFGLPGDTADIWMGSLSKALGSCGGFIAGNADLIDALRLAPAMLLTVGFPPTAAAAALTALEVLESEPDRLARLRRNTELFTSALRERDLDLGISQNTPICPVLIPGVARVMFAASLLLQRGIYVGPVTTPAVQPGQERLRFFITSEHTEQQVQSVADQIAEVVDIATTLDDAALAV
jgi:8-amino-7-oxononanoate synthase